MAVGGAWKGDNIKKSIAAALVDGAQKVLLYAEAEAKKLCPVDTGRLRASITHRLDSVTLESVQGQIGTNVEYAEHVEFGTSKSKAQPFLRPAIDKAVQKAPEIMLKELQKVSL